MEKLKEEIERLIKEIDDKRLKDLLTELIKLIDKKKERELKIKSILRYITDNIQYDKDYLVALNSLLIKLGKN